MLADVGEESGPEVARIVCTFSTSCAAERLARARAGPDGDFARPAGEVEREGPASNPSEPVRGWGAVGGGEGLDVAVVDATRRKMSRGNEVAEPSSRERIVLIIEGHPFGRPGASGSVHSSPIQSSPSARRITSCSGRPLGANQREPLITQPCLPPCCS